VLISTDKAVMPVNVMGATKRFAEMVLQGMTERGCRTRFCMVRFGNVLDSSGSVVPLFREQIRRGGPVTVTHPAVVRFFMTIPEAAQLVIQAGSMARGGDVFVLDMGDPVRIADLARRMIQLAGLSVCDAANPEGDLAIEYTGLRPGEKLFEELLIGNDVAETDHPSIRRAYEEALPWAATLRYLEKLLAAADAFDCDRAHELLLESVNGFAPVCEKLEDLVWQATRETGRRSGRPSAPYMPLPLPSSSPSLEGLKVARASARPTAPRRHFHTDAPSIPPVLVFAKKCAHPGRADQRPGRCLYPGRPQRR
jgi:FlaA1/EpsC-like NDP-sugar epimerase